MRPYRVERIDNLLFTHTIPFSEFFDGLLGMDILTLLQAQIHVPRQTIGLASD